MELLTTISREIFYKVETIIFIMSIVYLINTGGLNWKVFGIKNILVSMTVLVTLSVLFFVDLELSTIKMVVCIFEMLIGLGLYYGFDYANEQGKR